MSKKPPTAVIKKSMMEIAAEINKKLGVDLLLKGGDIDALHKALPRTTSGILGFDLALGGGWPLNQWNEIIGEESCGKTAICFRTLAANMEADPEYIAMWVASEPFVPEYAESFGVDLDRLWLVESNEMEQALALVIKAVESRAVDAVIIDSLPAFLTEIENAKELDEVSVATGAKILSQFFKKSTKAQRKSWLVKERDVLLIAINQWRDAIGVMYGDPRTTPGGKAKNYYYFTRVELRRDEWLTDGSKIEDRVGQSIKMRTIKNKTHRPQQSAIVDYYFTDAKNGFGLGDIDIIKDVVNTCISLEIIERRGAWYNYGDYKWNGKGPISEDVRADMGLQRELKEAAMNAVLGGQDSTENSTVVTDEPA